MRVRKLLFSFFTESNVVIYYWETPRPWKLPFEEIKHEASIRCQQIESYRVEYHENNEPSAINSDVHVRVEIILWNNTP